MIKKIDLLILFIILLLSLEIQLDNKSRVPKSDKVDSIQTPLYHLTRGSGFLKESGMKKIWKKLKEYEKYYLISNFGDIYSLKKHRILNHQFNKKGYARIQLFKKTKMKHHRISRLVAINFIGEFDGLEVNHIDGNKKNNHISNLEWCTHQENMTHWKNELRSV